MTVIFGFLYVSNQHINIGKAIYLLVRDIQNGFMDLDVGKAHSNVRKGCLYVGQCCLYVGQCCLYVGQCCL